MQAEAGIGQKSAVVNNSSSSFQMLKRLLKTGKKYMARYIALVIAALLVSALGLLETEGLRRVINAATEKNYKLLVDGAILLISVLVVQQAIEFFRNYFEELLNFNSIRNLQFILLKKMNRMLFKKYDSYHTGDLADRLKSSCSHAQSSLNDFSVNLIQNVVLIILITAYLLVLNIKMTIIAFVFVAILPVIISPLTKKLKPLYDESMKLKAEKSSMIQDTVQGAEIVKTYMLSDYFVDALGGLYTKITDNVKKLIPYESFLQSSNIIVIILGDFMILSFGGYLVSKGELPVGDVIAILLLFERLYSPVSYVSTIWPQFQASLASAGRVFEILDSEEEYDGELRQPDQAQGGDIEFCNVCFGYGNDDVLLRNVSFTAEKGSVTAIVGPSGSGKSTIIKLLMKLYSPDSGKITFGGIDTGNLEASEWRSRLSCVSQESSLFSGTVRENIRYGRLDASDEEIKEAAIAANIYDVIESRNEGFDALIGEKGIMLSGGERQRISIARAILAEKDILLLDEPTSALDTENEKKVMDALNRLMKNKTTIVVAHRLSTIINADKIICLENGKVAETGTHNELMQLKGRYYAMYNTLKEGELHDEKS